ncbi:hypothetical protein [Opitutus sp. ER46]|uniref:GNAT family N-acetyltransferase n=1 Tax=Opitutus sp. ER46 TaxID=2161864 RepID=UPI001304C006|nr:hypothetical protein [Opitutus sp. ER46]
MGFGSFDPRAAPQSARIGHNCIRPAYQGLGYGRLQLQEILLRLVERKVAEIHVSTLALPFFAPAQRMYSSGGFRLVQRTPWARDPSVEMLHFLRAA